MKVRVGSSWSVPRNVTGGCPQGSILGVFLFNVTTDDLEDDSAYTSDPGAPCPEIDEQFHHAPPDNPEAAEDFVYPDLGVHASDVSNGGSPSGETSEDSFHSARSVVSSPEELGRHFRFGRAARRVVYSS